MKNSETRQWVKERTDATPKHGTVTTSTHRATELVEAVFGKQYPAMASMLGPRGAATVEQITKEAQARVGKPTPNSMQMMAEAISNHSIRHLTQTRQTRQRTSIVKNTTQPRNAHAFTIMATSLVRVEKQEAIKARLRQMALNLMNPSQRETE